MIARPPARPVALQKRAAACSCLKLNYACMHAKPRCSAKSASTTTVSLLVFVWIIIGQICIPRARFVAGTCSSSPLWLRVFDSAFSPRSPLWMPPCASEIWVGSFTGLMKSFTYTTILKGTKMTCAPVGFSSRWVVAKRKKRMAN